MQALGLGFSTAWERRAKGLSIIQAARISAPKEMSGLPPKPDPTFNTGSQDRAVVSKIQGCDYHPGVQQIAFVDTETGELQDHRLQHREQAEKFYRELAAQGVKVGVGMEASGQARWLERLLAELKFELRIGDAAEIRAKRVRKKKTDREDARHILRLLMEDRFPRIWVPSWDNRDVRQLLWHRHRMVQMRNLRLPKRSPLRKWPKHINTEN